MNDPFWFEDGTSARGLIELAHRLESDERAFEAHVTSERNDFSAWIGASLGMPMLAQIVTSAADRENFIEILDAYLACRGERRDPLVSDIVRRRFPDAVTD